MKTFFSFCFKSSRDLRIFYHVSTYCFMRGESLVALLGQGKGWCNILMPLLINFIVFPSVLSCSRPQKVCLCPFLPIHPLKISTCLYIIQHPAEVSKDARVQLPSQCSKWSTRGSNMFLTHSNFSFKIREMKYQFIPITVTSENMLDFCGFHIHKTSFFIWIIPLNLEVCLVWHKLFQEGILIQHRIILLQI